MDAWSAEQLKKMSEGGNAKMNTFFQQYGVAKATDIKAKYHHPVAEVRRARARVFASSPPRSS